MPARAMTTSRGKLLVSKNLSGNMEEGGAFKLELVEGCFRERLSTLFIDKASIP